MMPRRHAAVLALVAMAASSLAFAQLRKGKALRPDSRSCVQCHRKQADAFAARPSKHAPVKEGNCESCHLRHGVVGVLRLASEDPELCVTCHAVEGKPRTGAGPGEGKGGRAAAASRPHSFTHPPAAQMKCGTCHDPHGSAAPHLLRGPGSAGCLVCHKAEGLTLPAPGGSAHPAGAADCLACHDPHGSKIPGSLARPAEQLCASCHDGSGAGEREGHGSLKPPAGSCLGCHAPHRSDSPGLLRRSVHPPILPDAGGCASCHAARGADPFAPTAKGAELCTTCHEDPRSSGPAAAAGSHVHPPVAEGDCTVCHTPHASDHAGLLKGPSSEVCGACHTEASRAREAKAPHQPAVGDCASCHAPHAGPAGLLKAKTPDLCVACHDPIGKQMAKKVAHPPAAEGDCLACHDPHGSQIAGMLKEAPLALCASCHDAFPGAVQTRVSHPPARAGDCAACHEVHGSDTPRLVAADLASSCLKCHASTATAHPEAGRHAPFAAGDCLSCHAPHGSSREGLLNAEPGRMCRACHGELAGEKGAESRHAPVQRGQCLSCHGPHGGESPALMRRADPKALCLSCHAEESREMARRDITVHPPFRDDSCLTCHKAHVSSEAGLLARAPSALCGGCHDIADAKMTAPHKGLVTASTDCTGCHEPHSSQSKALMLEAEHAPFAAGDCGSCHKAVKP